VERLEIQRQLLAAIGHPISEEQHVARFFLNNGLEDRDERHGEQAGLPGEMEQSEGEERIEALAVFGAHEGPFEIGGERVGGLLADRQSVALGHEREESRMPRLFVPLELDRLAKDRVALRPTEAATFAAVLVSLVCASVQNGSMRNRSSSAARSSGQGRRTAS
jgi:hypothetical protein